MNPSMQIVAVGAASGAMVSVLGHPHIAVGMLVASCGLFVFAYRLTNRVGVTEIEVGPTGFRAYIGAASVVIRWDNVSGFEHWGAPRHRQILFVGLSDRAQVIQSIQPDEPAARARLNTFGLMKPGLMFRPWIGGMSTIALEKSLRATMAPRSKTVDEDKSN